MGLEAGGFDLKPVSAEITYGTERVAMYLQGVESVYDLEWTKGITYGEIHHQDEVEFSRYNFEESNPEMLKDLFDKFRIECEKLVDKKLPLPAYDYCLKCSHTFNLLDARGAIGVAERASFIGKVRTLAKMCAVAYLRKREEMGFPLLKNNPW
ncbi:MAG: glycyl-tRNA synthetase alpha chain [Candidatus Dadabacteria bacterium]|nr:glycyl-tRNA synthetase alpha chain [Candidatus Dadabacteria bacterium]